MDWRNLGRAEAGFAVCLFLGLLMAGRTQMLADPGCMWHVTTGEIVLKDGFFRGDPFGYREYTNWFAKDWLSELYFAFAHRIGGVDTLVLSAALVLTVFFTFLFRRFSSAGCHWMLAVLLSMSAVAGSSFHFFARPLIFTLAFVGWLFGLFTDIESGRRPLRSMWWAVGVLIIWANLHPGVLGGVGSIGLVGGWWVLAWMLHWPTPVRSRQNAIEVCLWVLMCIGAIFVTPFGFDYVKLSLNLLSSPLLPILIEEHRPFSFTNPKIAEYTMLGFVAFYIPFLAFVRPWKPQASWIVSLVWMMLAFSRIRNAELFVVASSRVIAELLAKHPWSLWLASRGDWFVKPETTPVQLKPLPISVFAPLIVVVAVAVSLQAMNVRVPVIGRGWANLSSKVAPMEVLPELRAYERSVAGPTPVFNDLNFGGFLIYHTPKLKVFIDDRCELYGTSGLKEYVAVHREPKLIDQWADQYGYELALVAVDSPERTSHFDKYLASNPKWQCVKRGEVAAIYRRNPTAVASNRDDQN